MRRIRGRGVFIERNLLEVDPRARLTVIEFALHHRDRIAAGDPARGCGVESPRVMDSTAALELPDVPARCSSSAAATSASSSATVYAGARIDASPSSR